MKPTHLLNITFVAVALTLFTGAANADPITGTTSLGFGQVGVSLFGTDFFGLNSGDSQCDVPGEGPGCFDVLSGSGTFAGLVNFNPAINSIKDLPAPPLSGAIAIPEFLSFFGGAVKFDLVSVLPGGGQNCASIPDLTAPNAACTIYADYGTPESPNPQVSPYYIANGPDATTVSVSATMYFNAYSNSSDNGTSLYRGIFSTQLAGINISQIYGVIATGGTETSSWSASFSPVSVPNSQQSTATPEPGTWLLALAGGAALFMRKRRTRVLAAVQSR